MKIEAIKQINEKLPYWVKRPVAPVIRGKLINSPVFREQYDRLCKADAMPAEELKREQLRLLQTTLRHAYEHTVWYRRVFDSLALKPEDIKTLEDLQKLPVLCKQDLAEHYVELQADDIDDCYEVSTGGTTGKPTHIMMERDAIWREWAFIYHYWSKFGYDYRTARLATLRGVDLGKRYSCINPLYREIRLNLFLMNRDNIGAYVKAAERYRADYIYGYPSAVYNFCRLAREAGLSLSGHFKAALLISENLYPFQEEEITRTLGCPMAIFYGHSERAVFGERYENGYVFQPLYGITELSAQNTPIVTGFINNKMPLIRYEVDDHVERVRENMVEVTGHWNADLLEGKNGEQVSAAAINFHDGTFEGVEKYQFVQEQPGSCILNVVPAEAGLTKDQAVAIERSVNQKLGPALQCHVCVTETLAATERGKYQMVVQKHRGGVTRPKAYRIIGHRDREVLLGARGEQISVAAINFHDSTFDAVDGYQFVQIEPGRCILNVVPATGQLTEQEQQCIAKSVSAKLAPAIACEIRQCRALTLTQRGKYKMVLQNCAAAPENLQVK